MELKSTDQQTQTQGTVNAETGGIPETTCTVVTGSTTSIVHENLQTTSSLLEEILSRENMMKAYKAVKDNRGSAGVDGMKVSDMKIYLQNNWQHHKREILQGKYKPMPVKRVEIPKPNGGMRKLGIPTVLDRLIQQAILQRLQPEIDQTFSENSFGFRPGRSAHDAVKQLRSNVSRGYEYVVDIDLEKFFDTVPHDRLMTQLKRRIGDQRVLRLIRKFLNAGVLENGMLNKKLEGLPQGGPLSPLLSNIILDELDKELEKRGHKFARYADDCNIFVKSQRSGERVLKSISRYIETRLKLRVNREKSAVGKAEDRKFLGFTCRKLANRTTLHIADASVRKFKDKIRETTKIRGGKSFKTLLKELKPIIKGWRNYFVIANDSALFKKLDGWIRRRLRACAYSLMKNGKNRLAFFIKKGISYARAYKCAYSSRGIWHASRSDVMQQVLSNKVLKGYGLCQLS